MTRLLRPFNRCTPAWALLLVMAVLAKAILPQGVMLSYDAQHGAQVTPCPGHALSQSPAPSLAQSFGPSLPRSSMAAPSLPQSLPTVAATTMAAATAAAAPPDSPDDADTPGATSPPEPGRPLQGGHATCPFASAAAPVLPSSGAAAVVAPRSDRQAPVLARLTWVRVASSSSPPQSRAPPAMAA